MRKLAREAAYKLIFEYLFLKENESEQYKSVMASDEFSDNDKDYIKQVVYGVIQNFDALSETVKKAESNYKTERIYKSDLAVILLSAYELEFMKDIPTAVSINEAIEISKVYGTEKSSSFVNGILAGIKNGM